MFVVVKSVVTVIPPVKLVRLRYLVATAVLLAIIRLKGVHWHWDRRNGLLLLAIGLVGNALSITQETGTWLAWCWRCSGS